MITTILIVLVAVVVLIVIIAVLALRYLRADDSDVFDDIPDEPRPRRRPDHNSGQFPVSPERRQRQPVTEARSARQADFRGQQPGFRDRDTGPRPAVPERASSQAGGPRRAAAAARPTRAGRPADADAATSSWESLSDVDYWSELAADKSQHGQVPPLQRRQPARPPGAQPGRSESALPPPPDFDAPGRRGAPWPGAAQRPAASQRSGPPSRPQLPAAQAPPTNGHRGSGGPADDDPLTSPSFPAINAADSRSYRTRRSGPSQPGIGPDGYPASSDRTSRPDGYPVQSPAARSARHANGSQSASRAAQAAAQTPPTAPPSSSSAPAANPYGSFVSESPTQQHPSYPDIAAASRNTTDYPGYSTTSQPTAGKGRHSARGLGNGGAAGSAADGYLPAATFGAGGPASNGNGQGHSHNGSSPGGYAGIDYGSLRYDDPLSPDGDGSGLVGHAAPRRPGKHYDPAYGGSDPGYGQDGYQGYTGYGAGER